MRRDSERRHVVSDLIDILPSMLRSPILDYVAASGQPPIWRPARAGAFSGLTCHLAASDIRQRLTAR
jgi:hypothetical protein